MASTKGMVPQVSGEGKGLEIIEDAAARRWLAGRILASSISIVRRWSFLSLVGIGVTLVALSRSSVPLRAWPFFLVAPGFLLLLAFISAASYPLLRWAPQRWSLTQRGITGAGFRSLGTLSWGQIANYGIEPIAGLPGYYCVLFEVASAARSDTRSVVISPSMDISDVRDVVNAHIRPSVSLELLTIREEESGRRRLSYLVVVAVYSVSIVAWVILISRLFSSSL